MNAPSGRQRVDRLRAIPLSAILRAIDARADPHDPAKWHTARGTLSVNGAKFFNWTEAVGGGGAIDLAMHLNRMGFNDALNWLGVSLVLDRKPSGSAPAGKETSE